MSTSRSFRRGRGRRLWLVGATLIAAATFGIFFVAASGASGPCPIPGNFEIDGDMTQATCTPAADDWNTPNIGVQATNQGGTYSTAGKDDGDPSTWVSSGSTPDKTNFEQAYATSRVVGGHFFVFVAWERTDTSGTQGYAIEIDNSGSNVAADGTPQPKRDSGGSVFYISSQGSSAPQFDSACSFTSQSNYGQTCTSSNASVTSAINTASMSDPLRGTTQAAGSFFEVALDVTELTGIVPSCPGASAASVYLRSITGQTSNGNLKGYMAPLNVAPDSTCVPPPITTTATPGGSESAPGSAQHDDVTVGTAQAPGVGSVTFFLCSPADVANNGGDCSAGGTQVGSAATLDANGQASSDDVTGATTPNDSATGTYCWRAEFTPSANDHNYLPGSHTNSDSECFTVAVPDLTLVKTADATTVDAGTQIGFTITASNSNAAGTATAHGVVIDDPLPAGSGVDWSIASGPSNCSITGSVGSQTLHCIAVDLAPGDSETVHVVSGTEFASCAAYPNEATLTADNNPQLTADASTTVQCPSLDITKVADNETVNAGDQVGFTITVSNGGPGTAKAVTVNDPLPAGTVAGWSIDSQSNAGLCSISSDTLSCGPIDLAANESFSVHIVADTDLADCTDYDNTATAHASNAPDADGSASIVCNTPQPSIVTTQDPASGAIGATFKDKADLSGAVNLDGTGSITWTLYSAQDCQEGTVVGSETVDNITANGQYETPNGVSLPNAGTYYWVATFSGDSNNPAVSSGCNDEPVVVGQNSPSIATLLSSSAVNVGTAVHDSATLSGATADAGGTVTYTVYTDSECSAKFADAGSVTVDNGSVPDSSPVTFNTPGTYYWQASYSGDQNNQAALSTCTDEKLVVAPLIDLAITKTGSPASQELGQGNITWTMVVTNNGPDTATGVTISDPMPAGNTFVSATTSQGSCTGGAILTCNLGSIPAGGTVTITLVTTPSAVGAQTNTVTVVGNETETNTANNTATATVQVVGPHVVPKVYCVAVSRITPKQLFVGRKTQLTIHLSRHNKAVAGIKVQIKGPKLNITTKRSNSKGIIKRTLKMKKAGILVFTPLASKRCGTKRIGITGVFTPPVTG